MLLALSGLLFTGVPNFRAMGYAPGLVVLLIVAASVTLLPALLGLAGMRVYSRKARRTAHLEAAASHSPTAARLAHAVAGRPVAWMVASTVLLLALAAPALGMKLGNADAGNEAESTTIRQAYDLVADGFGPGANAPLLVAMDVDKVGGAGRHRRAHRRAGGDPRGRCRVAGPAVPRRLGGGGHRDADPRAAGRRDHRAARPDPGRAARRAPSSAASPRA